MRDSRRFADVSLGAMNRAVNTLLIDYQHHAHSLVIANRVGELVDKRLLDGLRRFLTSFISKHKKILILRCCLRFPADLETKRPYRYLVKFTHQYRLLDWLRIQHDPRFFWVRSLDPPNGSCSYQCVAVFNWNGLHRIDHLSALIVKTWDKIVRPTCVEELAIFEDLKFENGSTHGTMWLDERNPSFEDDFAATFQCLSDLVLPVTKADNDDDQRALPRPRARYDWGQNLYFDFSKIHLVQDVPNPDAYQPAQQK